MNKEKAEKIIRVYNLLRMILLLAFFIFLFVGLLSAQDGDDRLYLLEQRVSKQENRSAYKPQIHGILRGKYEFEPQLMASRFEVRNARLSASGKFLLRSEYKLEVDLCDESSIKMKDAWVSINPWRTLKLTLGQQRMPFSIDAHRNPSAQYFANRSFIAKQVGDMRDVGFQVGYDILNRKNRKVLSINAGIFNGSNLDEQKKAWFKTPGYSLRIQFFPIEGLAIIPSVQHQLIAQRKASYTSVDFGFYYKWNGLHVEAEYLHKYYANNVFPDCSAVDAMIVYKHEIKKEKCYIEHISYQLRYDYMQDHSSGKSGFANDEAGNQTPFLLLTDAERHRVTFGATFRVRNPYFPTDIRLNYEKYWYPHGGAKESEQDKLVCELVIKF